MMCALSYSITFDREEISQYLVQNKVMIYYNKSPLEKDLSPIFLVILKQDLKLLELMYENHSSQYIDATTSQGASALMFAAE